MGPKKKDAGKAANGEEVEGEDPMVLLSNYQKCCKNVGLPINKIMDKILSDDEKYPITQLLIDDEYGPLGPGGTRALMTSIMGSGPGMKGGPYKLLQSIRIWRSNSSDDGAAAIAEVLRLGGSDVKISYLELFDNNIGPHGGNALGQALAFGNNLSLLTLKLDYNSSFGTEGVVNLCRGLRTNRSLKQLHMQFCNITSDAGEPLAELCANSRSFLEVLNIGGNRLGGKGLSTLCKGLAVNTKLTTLCINDNMIDQTEEDLDGIASFRDVLMNPACTLESVDMMFNRIGLPGGNILSEALGPENTRIKEFLVDLTLPMEIFEKLNRKAGGKKGKKGKGGKKGKKK